jgi:hypothetical protein
MRKPHCGAFMRGDGVMLEAEWAVARLVAPMLGAFNRSRVGTMHETHGAGRLSSSAGQMLRSASL